MSLVTKTPWLRYTKWEQHFIDQDMKELHALTDLPQAADLEETLIANTVKDILHSYWDEFHDCLNIHYLTSFVSYHLEVANQSRVFL